MVQAWWLLHFHRPASVSAILGFLKGVVWPRAPLPPIGHRSSRLRMLKEGNLAAIRRHTMQVVCRLHVGKLPQPFAAHSEKPGSIWEPLERVLAILCALVHAVLHALARAASQAPSKQQQQLDEQAAPQLKHLKNTLLFATWRGRQPCRQLPGPWQESQHRRHQGSSTLACCHLEPCRKFSGTSSLGRETCRVRNFPMCP